MPLRIQNCAGENMTPQNNRQIQAMIVKRLYYDMRRYNIVRDYMNAKRKSHIEHARLTKRRLEEANSVLLEKAEKRLDEETSRFMNDLDALLLPSVEEDTQKKTLRTAFPDSPDYLKSFDIFL